MSIALDQSMNVYAMSRASEITHKLDGIKIDGRTSPDELPEVVGALDLINVEQSSTHPFLGHTLQHPICVSPNALICPQGPTYIGYPLPVMNDHGYVSYPMGGLIDQNPVGQFAPVYDGNLHPAQTVPYPQVFYPQFPVPPPQYPFSSAGHYTVAGPLTPEAGTMVATSPSPEIFMPHAFPYPYTSHFMPTATLDPPSGFNTVPAGMSNPLAPTWIEQPVYLEGPTYEADVVPPQLNHQPNVFNGAAHTGKLPYAMRQMPSTAMPCNGAWSQGQWQYLNAAEPLKASTLKNRRPEKFDLTSKTTQILPDLSVDFVDAKHFVIKSFSEENVCRSIQHGVWASTSNGNKKLDEAYQDAQHRAKGKAKGCPVFLYFSVNGSGRFCGVAEMVGRVDYDNTKDFWERSRWCGSFPVKWCIIKDVPNSQLRGILLKNNENKPVTSSRDTQEVNFEDGMRMLKIIKCYLAKASILDNHSSPFDVLLEGKSWQVSPLLQSSEQTKNVFELPDKAFVEPAKVSKHLEDPPALEESNALKTFNGEEPAEFSQHLEDRPALEESNALKTCNGEAKGRENRTQKKPTQTKEDESPIEDNGGRRQQVDKENVMISG